MIGVFDSGLGGKKTAEYIRQCLPDADLLYLGDTKHLPYGTKDPQFLRSRTFQCLEWMFEQGCSIVILACNTASAYAIRPWQTLHPDKKVLSVMIPGVEEVVKQGLHHPVLFATQATVQSDIYPSVFHRLYPDYDVSITPLIGTGLVQRIEQGQPTYELIQTLFGSIRHVDYDSVVMGCTHYPLVADQIQKIVGKRVTLIDPGAQSAQQLVSYLQRHPECSITATGQSLSYVTGDSDRLSVHIDL